jgi:hypothetical protein
MNPQAFMVGVAGLLKLRILSFRELIVVPPLRFEPVTPLMSLVELKKA